VTQHLGEIKMATRVGKYKLSKKETALSLADGGIVTNTLFARGYAAKAPSNVSFLLNLYFPTLVAILISPKC
jgi:hypothetical protein